MPTVTGRAALLIHYYSLIDTGTKLGSHETVQSAFSKNVEAETLSVWIPWGSADLWYDGTCCRNKSQSGPVTGNSVWKWFQNLDK